MRVLLPTLLLGGAACAAGGPEIVRRSGVPIPAEIVARADADSVPGTRAGLAAAQVSRMLAGRDSFESFRYAVRGARLGDGTACRPLLEAAEKGRTLCRRVYARLVLEEAVQGAPDRLDLLAGLARAWSTVDPVDPARAEWARRKLERTSTPGPGSTPLPGPGAFLMPLFPSHFRPSGVDAYRPAPDGSVVEATVAGCGNDRLLRRRGVLAFLTNDRGEPAFRGRHLWILNCSPAPVTVACPEGGLPRAVLAPGRAAFHSLPGGPRDEIDLTVGPARGGRDAGRLARP